MNLFSIFKSDDGLIEFLVDPADVGNIPMPFSASRIVPKWFKDIPPASLSGSRDHIGAVAMTAKKCMPMIDAMSLGFVIPLWADLHVRTDPAGELIDINMSNQIGNVADLHSPTQLSGVGKMSPTGDQPAIKFINRIVVKTPPEVSTLFMSPLGQFGQPFTCLPGLVDTDDGHYVKQVNFPAVWHARGFDDVIPAGTPLVTCIPVRRKDMSRNVNVRAMRADEQKNIDDLARRQLTRRGVYSNELREPRK